MTGQSERGIAQQLDISSWRYDNLSEVGAAPRAFSRAIGLN
jgi:hypothetical protein